MIKIVFNTEKGNKTLIISYGSIQWNLEMEDVEITMSAEDYVGSVEWLNYNGIDFASEDSQALISLNVNNAGITAIDIDSKQTTEVDE